LLAAKLVGTAQVRLCPPYGVVAMTMKFTTTNKRKHDT
jgi:hypothetical protein